jgi:hypothetical protein
VKLKICWFFFLHGFVDLETLVTGESEEITPMLSFGETASLVEARGQFLSQEREQI